MAVHDDVTALRDAVHALERASAAVAAHYRDNVDARRLQSDVARIAQDVHLLCGQEVAAQPPLEIIDDTVYPQSFWMDADEEGLGGNR